MSMSFVLRRFPPYVENRGSAGFAEDSHHSPNLLEQTAILPYVHADRSRIVSQEAQIRKAIHPFIPTDSPLRYSICCRTPSTSVGRRHTNRKGWSTITVQSGSRLKVACWLRSIRGRVAGQHVHGLLMVCHSVEI